jgi:tetratricopeptide (TPR) repeat protein
MNFFKFIGVFVILFTLSFQVSSIENETDHSFEYGKKLLFETRDKIYNFDVFDTSVNQNLARCNLIFSRQSDRRLGLYWTAKVSYLCGLVNMGKNDKKIALSYFEESRSILINIIKEYGEISNAYSLLADVYVQLLWCKGLGYKLANLRKLKAYPEKALSLDPDNVRANNSLALFCIKAPQTLGGNIDRAIELLKSIYSSDKVEMFTTYYILGTAYWQKNDLDNAKKYMYLALKLYPNNKWVLDDLKLITEKYSSTQSTP